MNQIFKFMDTFELYEKCIIASISHAIMVGKYPLLAAEQSWDDINYNFQDMVNGKGTISFKNDRLVCVIQINKSLNEYELDSSMKLLDIAPKEIQDLATNEALLYMLEEVNGEYVSIISIAFWGEKNKFYSKQLEKEIIEISSGLLIPYVLSKEEAWKYWKDYYEMSEEQLELAKLLFKKRILSKDIVILEEEIKHMLEKWFINIDECLEAFAELKITF